MRNKVIQDQVTGSIRQPAFFILLAAFVLFGLHIFMASALPNFSKTCFYLALPLGIIGAISLTWLNFQPNLLVKFLGLGSLGWLWAIISLRAFTFLLPEFTFLFGFLIIVTTIFSQSLHLWNPKLTELFKSELSFTPKTKTGKLFSKWALRILPIAGLIGSGIGLFFHRLNGGPILVELMLGPLCWFLAISLPFSSQFPISPWEYKK